MGCDSLPTEPDWDWSPPQEEEPPQYDNDDVDIVLKLESSGGAEKAVAIAIPCVLALCMMVLLYNRVPLQEEGYAAPHTVLQAIHAGVGLRIIGPTPSAKTIFILKSLQRS